MGAGHYSSPGGGGRGRRILVHYDQLDLITPIRLCNIITTPTPPHPPHKHTNLKIKQFGFFMFQTTYIHSLTSVNTPCNLWQGKILLARLSKSQRARQK